MLSDLECVQIQGTKTGFTPYACMRKDLLWIQEKQDPAGRLETEPCSEIASHA